MMKLSVIVPLVLLAGPVFALPNNTPVTAAEAAVAANTIYLSGSSAATAIISGLILQNCTGFTTPGVTYGTSFVTFSDTSGNYNAYACRVANGNVWGQPENTVVVVNKRDDQGSGLGAFPIAYNTPIDFLNLAGTPQNGKYPLTNHTPDIGISDTDPFMFNAPANRPLMFATSAAVLASNFAPVSITWPDRSTTVNNITTLFSQVFGIAVTEKLYTALQAAGQTIDGTATGIPSLSRNYLANLLSTNIGATGWISTDVANATAGINICFGNQGSGSRTVANSFFLNYPANLAAGILPLDKTLATVMVPDDASGSVYINEAGSESGVQACLANVNSLSIGYGLGILALNSGTTPSYRFVAIDGVPPSRDAAKNGKYGFWTESTAQVNKLSQASASAKQFIVKLIREATVPSNLARLSASAQLGVFALPFAQADYSPDDCSTYAGNFPVTGGVTAADKFCSRYTRNGDNKALPVFVK